MVSIYLESIRSLYKNKNKLKMLILFNLYNEYLNSVNILSRYEMFYNDKDIENLINWLPKLESVRSFIVKYVITYLSYTGQYDDYTIYNLANAVNYYVSTIMVELDKSIEFFITKAKGEKAQYLAIQKILINVGELLEFFRRVLVYDPDDAIDFIRIKYNYIQHLVKRKYSVAKTIKQLGEELENMEISLGEESEESNEVNIGDLAKQLKENSEDKNKSNPDNSKKGSSKSSSSPKKVGGFIVHTEDEIIDYDKRDKILYEEYSKQPIESSNLVERIKSEYSEKILRNEEERTKDIGIFDKIEIQLLYYLIKRGVFCPKETSLQLVSEFLGVGLEKALKIANQIDRKLKERFGDSFLIVEDDKYTVCIVKRIFNSIKPLLVRYHPDLVRLYDDVVEKMK